MNPIKLSKQLQETFVSYLTATFDVNRDGREPELAHFIQRSFNRPRALFAGPYLELTAPYKTAESLEELVQDGVIDPRLLEMPCFAEGRPLPINMPLYTHQAAALRKLCKENRSIVVSSGTGSGKTECFLIPILNDLIVDPTPGVRAVLIYPLNALVNDQLDRLRILLRGTDITFGRYTSELENSAARARKQMEKEWDEMEPARRQLFDQYPLPNEIIGRDQIREQGQLPQILITNYAMLEYLLLRPQDSVMFNHGKWRFVVLDEAHSYAGAQGIEIGLLMRRLKHRLGIKPQEMRCIATSATLTDDDAEDARLFAKALFGEEFTKDDVIFGQSNHHYIPLASSRKPPITAYTHKKFGLLLDKVRQEKWDSVEDMALLMEEMGLIEEDDLSLADTVSDTSRFLWEILRDNEHLTRLRRYMVHSEQPVEVTAVGHEIFADLTTDQQAEALFHLIELAAMARPAIDEPSLLPARYHLFVRPPQGLWACLNPTCASKSSDHSWSKLFAEPRKTCDVCTKPVYPLVVCRTCGQVYVRLQKVGKQYASDAPLLDEPQKRYVTWRPIHENRALADEDEIDDEDMLIKQSGARTIKQTEFHLCLACQEEVKANGKCACDKISEYIVDLYLLEVESSVGSGKNRRTKDEAVEHMKECGRCHSRALKNTEIATEISLNALTPLAILTDDLYRSLPESNQKEIKQKAGGGRKLLSFYDSRQGAARFAAFVQDVVNRQAYRRIVREAISDSASPTFWPDLERVSQISLKLALEYRVAHNDPDISKEDLPRDALYLSQSQKQGILAHMRKQVFAEITTELRSRQSLEALGMISVEYWEPDNLPDFNRLANSIGLTTDETRTLIEYLLDDLRRGKVVQLPGGVNKDDAIFGRNEFSPRLVRHKNDTTSKSEIAWIGKTIHQRRRQLVRKILAYKKLANDETAVINTLGKILDWLIDHSGVLDTSKPQDGYQIRCDRLFFRANSNWYRCHQCQRLNNRGDSLPCPHAHCRGTLELVGTDTLGIGNFYYDNLRQRFIPMRIEEHTAQLAPEEGRKYQNLFKSGEINMLSCSTTFEMGIDLGDLQAVVMSNIPPTVANYKQRAGRAGRRTSGTAFILAWASNRPHDQAYFKTPTQIINGRVRVPYINVENHIIIQRHINAILLSEFLRFCAKPDSYNKHVGAFFDQQTPGGSYYSLLSSWLNEKQNYLLSLLELFGLTVNKNNDATQNLKRFEQDLTKKGYENYNRISQYYKDTIQQNWQVQQDIINRGETHNLILLDEIKRYSKLSERLKNQDLINYLSDRGVLPSYSFPLHIVELHIPPKIAPNKQLRLQRSLQQAIREYAPGQEVVADKRIWKSDALEFFGKLPEIYAYYICPTCNYLQLADAPGKNLENLDKPCPVCQAVPERGSSRQNEYIQPDGFRASLDSGQTAGQYVDRPLNLMRSSLVPKKAETRKIGNVLAAGYDRSGDLLYVNEGFQGSGFRVCPRCGKNVNKGKSKCDGILNGKPCSTKIDRGETYTLGFKQSTDTLHLKFSSTSHISLPSPEKKSFWLSLKYALLQGASHALQIERQDIDAVLFPESLGQLWQQTIVLYDNVPGGAGHVKRIENEIKQVVAAALEILNCECEESCYRCLREYANQWEHHLLDRHEVIDFLRALDADLQKNVVDDLGWRSVAAVNQLVWFWEKLQQTQYELILSLEKLTIDTPVVNGVTLLDLIQQLLQRNVKVRLFIKYLSEQGDGESIIVAAHLRLLLGKNLQIWQTNRLVPWTAVLDNNSNNATAIKTLNLQTLSLSNNESVQLAVTESVEAVNNIYVEMKGYNGRYIEYSDLREPPDIHILEVKPDGKKHNETDYFSDFYSKPVFQMTINDRYLFDDEKIVNRLGAHIDLANQHKQLKKVIVYTRSAEDKQQQERAINHLKRKFSTVDIEFKRVSHTPHDRYIEIMRDNGHKARVIIGHGLDFIESTGNVRQTFLVFQDSYSS